MMIPLNNRISGKAKISIFVSIFVLIGIFILLVLKFNNPFVKAATTVEILTSAATSSWTTSYAPYNTYYMDSIAQSIYLKSDLNAAGISGASTITEICFQCATLPGRDIANFRIKMKNTTATSLSAFDTTGLTVVYGPTSYTKPVAGAWQCHTLTTPFNWDGTSNLLIEAYRNDSAWRSGGGNYVRTAASGRTYAGYCDNCTGCGVGGDCYTPSSRSAFAQVMNLKLTYAAANPSPSVPTLIAPADGVSSISLTPNLQFTYSDPNGDSATQIQIMLDDNSDFSSPIIGGAFDPGYSSGVWPSGSTASYGISGADGYLSVNGHYYWKARVYDGTSWSGWSDGTWDFFTITNNPPNTPALVSPSYDSTGISEAPTLQFSYSDSEANSCTKFDLQVDDNSDFSSPVINETNYSTGGPWASGSTIGYAASGLAKGTKYYWKVRVYDGSSWSGWTGGTGLNLGSMKSLSTERYSSCAVSDSGNVYCWGWNNYRKIGNNTTTDSYTPARVLGVGGSGFLTDVGQVETGAYHACALKNNGTIFCWGSGESGRLGNNSTDNSYTPVQTLGVGGLGYLTGVSQVDAGTYHTCAVKTDGTAYCWGYNISGQIGNNTFTDQLVPAQVKGVGGSGYLTGVSQIAAGYGNTCAVKTDGTVYCWGDNAAGQIGNNTTTDSSVPVQVLGVGGSGYLTGVSQVEVGDYPYGDYHTCAVKTDGSVYCWGSNANGRLGNNTTTASYTPVQVLGPGGSGTLTGVSQVEVGEGNSCALKDNGTVYCWGKNNNGQLGNNTTTDSYTPIQTLGLGGSGFLSEVYEMGAGVFDSCALKDNGTVYCWGDNAYGQLGNNSTTDSWVPVQVLMGEAQSQDTDIAWPFTTVEPNAIPLVYMISPNNGASGISLTPKLQFQYWDNDSDSCVKFDLQLDDNADFSSPVVNLSDYSVGGPWANGSTISYTVPSALSQGVKYYWKARVYDGEDWSDWSGGGGLGLGNITDVVSGVTLSCSVSDSGNSYCWGCGYPGNNTQSVCVSSPTIVPVQVLDANGSDYLTEVEELDVDISNTCFLKSDDTIYCVGRNNYGALGDNTTITSLLPVQTLGVGGSGYLTGLKHVSSGNDYSCAVKTDGTVYCWGINDNGKLGINNTVTQLTPVQVLGVGGSGYLTGVEKVYAAYQSTCALKTDGTVFCWGQASSGELGNNSTFSSFTPVQVLGPGGSGYLTNVIQMSKSADHACALKSDGTVYCWGWNGYGAIGNNSTTDALTPVQVLGPGGSGYLTGVAQINAGFYSSCAIKNDNTVWCWGHNNYGQLGNNTTTDALTPVQVLGVGGSGYLTNVEKISSGGYHTCAVKEDSVYCWGRGDYGQLGNSSTVTSYTPVQVLKGEAQAGDTDVSNSFTTRSSPRKFTLKKSDGCFCLTDNECYSGTCGASVCGGSVSGPTLTNLTPPADNSENYCKCWLNTSNIKQSGRDGNVIFSWVYQDTEDIPLTSYQMKISDVNDVDSASIYKDISGANYASGSQIDTSAINVVNNPASGQLAYNKTYYWWAKGCNANACTDWTAGPSFSTPIKHYPVAGLAWTEDNITANEDIQFCSTADINDSSDPCYSACWTGTGDPIPADPTLGGDWKCSLCYGSGSSLESCYDVPATQYTWIFPGTEGSDYVFVSSTSATSPNPIVKFLSGSVGLNKTVKLKVSGSTCGDEENFNVYLPNPVWQEKNPF